MVIEATIPGEPPVQGLATGQRPDVAAAFPDLPQALHSGFALTVRVPDSQHVQAGLAAVLETGERVGLGVIRLARRSHSWMAADTPLVSVVIPCHNRAHFLGEAIASVRRQTYPRIEVVVVDDGSTDETAAVAAELGALCIRQENRGAAAARNRGLAESKGDYIVFLDADDRLLEAGIEANVDALSKRPEVAFVAGWSRAVTSNGGPIWPFDPAPWIPPEREQYALLLEFHPPIQITEVMFRRSVLVAAGGFDESLPAVEDWDLYLRLGREHQIYRNPGGPPIFEYRLHPTSTTRNAGLMLGSALRVLRSQRRWVRGDPSLRAAWRLGRANMRNYYGERLAGYAAAAVRSHRWRDAARALRQLVRHYPRGLLSAISPAWGPGPVAFDQDSSQRPRLRVPLGRLREHLRTIRNAAAQTQGEVMVDDVAAGPATPEPAQRAEGSPRLFTTVFHDVKLLPHFLGHYRTAGIRDFVIAVPHWREDEIQRLAAGYEVTLVAANVGESYVLGQATETVQRLRELHQPAGAWAVVVDLDEFVAFPRDLASIIAAAEEEGANVIKGVLHDRFSLTGQPVDIDRNADPARVYPVRARFVRDVMRGCDRKPVLVKGHLRTAPRSDRYVLAGERVASEVLEVDHYRWIGGSLELLNERSAVLRQTGVEWVDEFERAIRHYEANGRFAWDRFGGEVSEPQREPAPEA